MMDLLLVEFYLNWLELSLFLSNFGDNRGGCCERSSGIKLFDF